MLVTIRIIRLFWILHKPSKKVKNCKLEFQLRNKGIFTNKNISDGVDKRNATE